MSFLNNQVALLDETVTSQKEENPSLRDSQILRHFFFGYVECTKGEGGFFSMVLFSSEKVAKKCEKDRILAR